MVELLRKIAKGGTITYYLYTNVCSLNYLTRIFLFKEVRGDGVKEKERRE